MHAYIRSGLISRIKKSLILSNIDILRFIRLILCYFMMGILKVVKFAICHHSLSLSLNIIHISWGEHFTHAHKKKQHLVTLFPITLIMIHVNPYLFFLLIEDLQH